MISDADYFAGLRAGLIVHPHGPGIDDPTEREIAWLELRGMLSVGTPPRPDPSAVRLVLRLVSHTPAHHAARRARLAAELRPLPTGDDAA
jgi:hypothetical protein